MFNHYRTLLANLTPGGAEIAEERVPAEFTPVRVPDCVRSFRRIVFGTEPDRAMVNYRTRQLMAVVHASPLHEWVTKLDARIAYNPKPPLMAGFTPVVVQVAGPETRLTVLGAGDPPDDTGVMRLAFGVDVLTTSTVKVSRHVTPLGSAIYEYALNGGGVSEPIPLTGSGFSFRLATDDPGAEWAVSCYLRPARDPGELVVRMESVGDAHLTELFGLEGTEPWVTLRRIWNTTRETPLRLAAVTTAAVYRTEEARGA